jgi:glucose/arabinose dehydrogenase
VLDPHAAVSGIVIVTGELGDAIGTSALVAEWATGLVQQVPLSPSAESGQQATARPFISGVKNPVALARTPDGAVLVGDWTTGVVYRISPA